MTIANEATPTPTPQMMPALSVSIGRSVETTMSSKARREEHEAGGNCAGGAVAVGEGAGEGLGEAPGEVLHGHGHAPGFARHAEVGGDGRVKRPKLVRMPLVTAAMMQPAMTRTSSGTASERVGAAVMVVMTGSGRRRFYAPSTRPESAKD